MKKILLIILAMILVIGALTAVSFGAETDPAAQPAQETQAPTEAPAPVDYPQIKSITPDTTGFTIQWTAYEGAAKYRLFYRGASGWVKIGDTAALTMRHANLKDQATYTYTVRALNQQGKYMSSYLVKGWTFTFRSAPEITSVAASGNTLKIVWKPVEDAGCYRIYRNEGAGWVRIDSCEGTTYTDENVVSGKTYSYRVRAFDAEQTTILSAYQATGKSAAFVSMPVISGIEAKNTGVRISWKKADGAVKYRVFIKAASGWKRVGETSNLYYDYAIKPNGVETVYTVRAADAKGNYISDFIRDNAKHTFLETPKLVSLTNFYGGQTLTWQKVEGANIYRIYVKNGSSWKKLVDTTAVSYNISGRKGNTSYTYTVRCISDDSKMFLSGFSSSGLTLRYYATPLISSVENLNEGAKITWKAVSGVSRYRVFTKSDPGWKKLADVSGTEYLHRVTVQGKEFTYTVRAIDAKGAYISGYSSKGYTNRYQTAPLVSSITPTDDGMELTWELYDDVEAYRVYRRVLAGKWEEVADVTGTAYTDTSAPAGAPYQYTLRCLDADGKTISDCIEDTVYYADGKLADGKYVVKGYEVTFDKGELTRGYVTAQDIIRIAQAEVGTKATNYKRCKYNTWYYGADVSGDAYDWCVVFFEWVFNQANASELLIEKTAGCELLGAYFYYADQLVKSDYRVGDLVLIHWSEGYSGYVPGVKLLNHVGLVIAVNDDGTVTTIEGNTGSSPNGEVMIKTRRLEQISCACRPKYGFYVPAGSSKK